MKKQNVDLKTVADRLAYLLKAKHINQATLANALGMNQTSVSRWLKGSIPETRSVIPLTKRLGVSEQWLIYGVGATPSEAAAFLVELKEHRLPAIESLLAGVTKNPDPFLAAHPEYPEQLQSIRHSLLALVDHAEKTGEVLAPPHLEYPARFITKDRLHIIDEGGTLSRLREQAGALDIQMSRAMVCNLLDLPVGASADEIRKAYALHMARREKGSIKVKRTK